LLFGLTLQSDVTPNAFMAIWCLHATFHNNAQPGSSPVLPDDD
jgi:hypothetical protein